MSLLLRIRSWYNYNERQLMEENAMLRDRLAEAEAEAKASARDAERFQVDADRMRREMYRMAERYGAK